MKKTVTELKQIANEIRKLTVEGIYCAQSGHPGGSLSICDMLSVLLFDEMNADPEHQEDADRDRFVLSKGHAAPAYYAALALRGYFPVQEMRKLRQIDSFLQGHPCRNKIPGVDMSSGSLGQGLSVANGMALSGKTAKKSYRVYCICGDGELQEGEIWEALMTGAHYRLDNLTLLIDCNELQIDGSVQKVMNIFPLIPKLQAFGWNTIEVDGHEVEALQAAMKIARATKEKPTAVLCHTMKGKGVSFMENRPEWHGGSPDETLYRQAMEELNQAGEVLYG